MPTLKSKSWTIAINQEAGITYIRTTGDVPQAVKKAVAQIAKTNVGANTAARILKTQFAAAIVAVED